MSTLQRFEANQLPLGPGLRLLEASAGTGKTFALAHLVLRLLTEGADPPAVEQLLVVTFTEAAASELRDRIARRLQQALQLLDQPEANLEELDGPLQGWLERHRPQPSAPLRGRLLLALEQLDRADITTIHGFCRRTLQRQALEAGLGPAVSLESDGQERRQQLVHDYWRQQVLPLEPGLLAGLQQLQVNPAQLLQLVASLDGDPALALDPLPPELNAEQPLAPQLSALWPQRWGAFLEHWRTSAQALEADLAAAATELHSLGLEYKPYRLKPKADRLERVEGWIAGLDSPPTTPRCWPSVTCATTSTPARSPRRPPRPTGMGCRCRSGPCWRPSPPWWRGRRSCCCCTSPTGPAASWRSAARPLARWASGSCSSNWIRAPTPPPPRRCWRRWRAATGPP